MKKYLKYVLLGIMTIMVMGTLTAYAANRETKLFGSYDSYAPLMNIHQECNIKDEKVPSELFITIKGTVDKEMVTYYSMELDEFNDYQASLDGWMDPCYAVTTDNKTTVYPVDYTVKVNDMFDAEGNVIDLSKYNIEVKTDKKVTKDCKIFIKDDLYPLDIVTRYDYTLVITDKPKTTQVVCKIEWKDEDASKRPQNVVVTLSNEDGTVGNAELTAENNWEYVFKDLPVASAEGKAYTYKVAAEIEGYDVVVNDNNVITATAKKPVKPVEPEIPVEPETPVDPKPEVEHVILNGADQTVKVADKEVAVRIEGNPEELTGVYVDNKLVDPKNYTVTKGSVIVTFHKDFIASLGKGKHTVAFSFNDVEEKVETTLTIAQNDKVQADSTVPKTGDMSNMGLWISLMLLASTTAVVISRKKEHNH